MYSVRIGYEGYEITLMFRGEKEAREEYDLANKGWMGGERGFTLKDGFKRQVNVDFGGAVAVTFTDEEAAAMARAEIQLLDARAQMAASKRFQAENPALRYQTSQPGLVRPS